MSKIHAKTFIQEETVQEVSAQKQSVEKVVPLNNCNWINKLAEKVATCLTTHGIPSKE